MACPARAARVVRRPAAGRTAARCNAPRQALDTDPDCSLALAIDGLVHTNLLKRLDIARERYSGHRSEPEQLARLAAQGTLHAFIDEGNRAVEDTELALKLSPLDPHRYYYDSLSATAHLTAGHYDRALELAQRSLRANRSHTSTLRVMTVAQWQLGRRRESRKTAQELLRLEPGLTVSDTSLARQAHLTTLVEKSPEVLHKAGIPSLNEL